MATFVANNVTVCKQLIGGRNPGEPWAPSQYHAVGPSYGNVKATSSTRIPSHYSSALMFGLFAPRCPVQTHDQAWIETRMQWLVEQFGVEQLRKTEVILPTARYFPDPWPATEAATYELFGQFCEWMKIPRDRVGFEIVEDEQMPFYLGHYSFEQEGDELRPMIRIQRSLIDQPPQLAATLAHELAHDHLIGQGRLNPDVSDHEQVTDLLPIFFGLGVVLANATITESVERMGHLSWESMSRAGYLSSQQLGYALALFAWCRQETAPNWAQELRLDAASTLKAGLRYLGKSQDCLFQPSQPTNHKPVRATSRIIEQLTSNNAARRLAICWQLRDNPPADATVIESLGQLVEDYDRQLVVAVAAVQALAAVAPGPVQPVTPILLGALAGSSTDLRIAAIRAFASLQIAREQVTPALVRFLGEDHLPTVKEAALALAAYGETPRGGLKALVLRLAQVVNRNEPGSISLAHALCLASPNPDCEIAEWLDPDNDPELYGQVVAVVAEARAAIEKEKEPSSGQRD